MEKTNLQMYKEIQEQHEKRINKSRPYEEIVQDIELKNLIVKTFNLENRNKLDLNNLLELVVINTICNRHSDKEEGDEIGYEKHKIRCDLMSAIIIAVNSTLYPNSSKLPTIEEIIGQV